MLQTHEGLLCGYKDATYAEMKAMWAKLAKETHEQDFQFDLFLSYSTKDRDQAATVVAAAEALGLTIFQDRKDIEYGEVWAEEIRLALMSSREIALLASPSAMASEWVQTEWGAAWALERTITPIMLMMPPAQLPARLQQRQAVIYGDHQAYLEAVLRRRQG